MKLLIISILLLPSVITNVNNSHINLYQTITYKLYKLLDFIEENHKEFHFDGLLGITFARAFLIKSLQLPIEEHVKPDIHLLINKCITIHNKIYPFLSNSPKYMIIFRNYLLDAKNWNNVLPNKFLFGKIKYLGYYKNWTADTIIKNTRAVYKGIKSDTCLREILELSDPNRQCYVSSICEEMMLDENRIDTGYLLTHRLLYLQIIKLHGCILRQGYFNYIPELITLYCSHIYKEARTSDKLSFPNYDIFMEQVVLCGMEGYAEFLDIGWLHNIMQWQNPQGCYKSTSDNITKRSSFAVGFGCSDHTTGLGAAVLALHLRYLLTENGLYPFYKD